jgi:transposase
VLRSHVGMEDAENGLTDHFRSLLQGVWNDLVALDDRVGEMDQAIKRLAENNEDCMRLQ